MVRGLRPRAVILNPAVQPQAQYLFDPITRRAVRYVETIVPTVNLGESVIGDHLLADRYYCNFGGLASTSAAPGWHGGQGNCDFKQWDASDERFYGRFSNTAGVSQSASSVALIYYGGPFGVATDHAPKNFPDVTTVRVTFRARFNANADYTVYGVGAASANTFATSASNHYFQVLRNTTAWELGTCDGTTISQSSGGTGDGNLHDFAVEWDSAALRLYVDGALTITKTTNRPARPLNPRREAENNTNTIDLVDYMVEWF